MATPHIESKLEDIAPIVLMPGDPKRAEYIAKKYLTKVKLINQVRGMMAYTGYYKNNRITIFPSGIGSPSMGIYAHELFSFYNVKYIIRIGTMGSYVKELNVGDVFLATKSYSNSAYIKVLDDNNRYPKSSDYLNKIIKETAKEENVNIKTGTVYSTDIFYSSKNYKDISKKFNVMGVEMESFSLLEEARRMNRDATTICTVSDSFVTKVELTSEERQNHLDNMIKLALNSSLKIKK
ncbi:MAG: purine-nucleoside phosphorylase [Bacilli bacterium]|nr:purine-nucleoside phosphorylase [Bacilli bacterium]